jgi:hypothetical protein
MEKGLNPRIDRFLSICLLAVSAVVALSFLAFPPFWGLMDDATNLKVLLPLMREKGLLGGPWEYARRDFSWGMVRPLYPLMVYGLYLPGQLLAPWVTFALNAFVSVAAVAGLARHLARRLGASWKELLVLNVLFAYEFDLLQHPSLQEKLVLLFAWGFFHALAKAGGGGGWFLTALGFCALGFLSKASFLVYFSVGFLFWCQKNQEALRNGLPLCWARTLLLAALGLGAGSALFWVARHGSYTHAYGAAGVRAHLGRPVFWLPLALLAFALAGLNARRKNWSPADGNAFALGVGAILFFLLFLPWGLAGYLLSLVGPLAAAFSAHLLRSLRPRWKEPAFALAGALAIAASLYKVPPSYARLHDLGAIVSQWHKLARPEELVFLTCPEGAEAMEFYLRTYAGVAVKVNSGLPQGRGTNFPGSHLGIFDDRMCPAQGNFELPGACRLEPVHAPAWPGSYRMVRLVCG